MCTRPPGFVLHRSAYPVDRSKRCSSIRHTSRQTRPLAMSEEAYFPNSFHASANLTRTWCYNMSPLTFSHADRTAVPISRFGPHPANSHMAVLGGGRPQDRFSCGHKPRQREHQRDSLFELFSKGMPDINIQIVTGHSSGLGPVHMG